MVVVGALRIATPQQRSLSLPERQERGLRIIDERTNQLDL
jgi:hypothetical protein